MGAGEEEGAGNKEKRVRLKDEGGKDRVCALTGERTICAREREIEEMTRGSFRLKLQSRRPGRIAWSTDGR